MRPDSVEKIGLILAIGFILVFVTLLALVQRVFKAWGIGQSNQGGKKELGEEIETRSPQRPIGIRLDHVVLGILLTNGFIAGWVNATTIATRVTVFFGCFLGFAAIAYAVLMAYVYLRHYLYEQDSLVDGVLKRAEQGAVEGAIDELNQIIEQRGPSGIRANALGHCFSLQGKWQEAHKQYVEAERLAGHRAIILCNQGWSLAKMGFVPDAIAAMEEACALEPGNPALINPYCVMLVDLGRFDEAAEQSRILEPLRVNCSRPGKRLFDEVIEQLRLRIKAGLAAEAQDAPEPTGTGPKSASIGEDRFGAG